MTPRSFDHRSAINFMRKERGVANTTLLSITYVKPMRESISHEADLVDIDTFISYCGGGLGLFLGFSLVDTLLFVSDLVLNRIIS